MLRTLLYAAIMAAVIDAQCSLTGTYQNFALVTPPAPASGSILGTLTTYTIGTLAASDNCQWQFQCANTSHTVHVTSISSNTGYGIISIYDASNNLVRQTQSSYPVYNQLSRVMLPPGAAYIKFVGQSGTVTLTIQAQCANVGGQCDSALYNTYPTATYGDTAVLTTYPGTIQSDQDGIGSTTYYYNNNKCRWMIQCPTNYFVQTDLSSNTNSPQSDYFNFLDPAQLLTGNQAGTYTNYKLLFNSPLYMWFNSTAKTSVGSTQTSYGFSLSYTCVAAQRCSSSHTITNYGGYTVSPGGNTLTTIMSDADGSGQGTPYWSNENCLWTLQCPTNWNLAVVTMGASWNGASPSVKFTANGVQTDYTSTTVTTSSSFFIGADSMTISFTTIAAYLTPGSTARGGFTMSFYCYPMKCSAGSGTYDGATAGSLQTASPYLNNEACTWTVFCSNGYAPRIVNLYTAGLGSGDTIVVTDSSGATVRSFNSASGSINLGSTGDTGFGMFPKPSLTVTFTSDSATTGNAITFQYGCVNQQSQCSANYLASTYGNALVLSSSSGSINNVYPSAGSYLNNERCKWYIGCSGNSYVYITAMTVRAGTGDSLSFTDGQNNVYSYTGSTVTNQNSFYNAPLNVQFNSDATLVGNGFQFSYLCSAQQCSSTDTVFTKTSLTGTIKSDSDGYGSAAYANLESCLWTIQCPSGWKVAIDSVQVSTYNSNDNIQFIDAGSGSPNYVWYGSVSLTGDAALDFRTVDSVQLKFQTDSINTGNGFTASYTCYKSQCSSQNQTNFPYTWYPGTIKTDPDSYNTAYYARNNERCQWTIQCPTGSFVQVPTLTGSSAGTGDIFQVVDALGGTVSYSNGFFSRTVITIYSTDRVVVNWYTDGATRSAGAQFTYNCMYTQNQALAASPYVPTGFCSGTAYRCSQISAQCSSINTACTNSNDPCYQVKLACQQVLSSCNTVSNECTLQSNAFCPNSILI